MKLSYYFEAANVRRALDAYFDNFGKSWDLPTKLSRYNDSKKAFVLDVSRDERYSAMERIYRNLRDNYKLTRGGPLGMNSEEVLETCLSEGEGCRREALNLMNLPPRASAESGCILDLLWAMNGIKRNTSGYAWVASSKFLHFYNPTLFPIYDIGYIWNEGLNFHFKSDYKGFCQREGMKPGETTHVFNLNYTLMAREYIRNADEETMAIFAEWFRSHCKGANDPHDVLTELDTYYATAFENILLGAVELEKK